MSGKLDQSLDEILSTQRSSGARRGAARGPRRSTGRPAATAAPVGGVQKSSKQKGAHASKQAPAKAALSGDSKVVVSNLVSTSTPLFLPCCSVLMNSLAAQGCERGSNQGMFPLRPFKPVEFLSTCSIPSRARETHPNQRPAVAILHGPVRPPRGSQMAAVSCGAVRCPVSFLGRVGAQFATA